MSGEPATWTSAELGLRSCSLPDWDNSKLEEKAMSSFAEEWTGSSRGSQVALTWHQLDS